MPIISQGLKKLANKWAKKLYTEKNYAPKKANTFEMFEIEIIIKYLWSLGIREKEASLMLCFNFLTGCRVGDLKFANFKDLEYVENESGHYITIPLKISKTNPMSLKTEQITVKIKPNTVWDVNYKLNYLKNYRLENNKKLGRIFQTKSTSGYVYQMENMVFKTYFQMPPL